MLPYEAMSKFLEDTPRTNRALGLILILRLLVAPLAVEAPPPGNSPVVGVLFAGRREVLV
jgi:hypothetical protein